MEFVMSSNQSNRTWQAELVARYPNLFNEEFNGRVTAPGYPTCGDGWRDLVQTAVGRIASAVAAAPNGSLKVGQIKEKFATLRVYLDSRNGLPEASRAAVDEAISLAEARSACTCETCGEPGRLYKNGGWFLTACEQHAKGKAVEVRPVARMFTSSGPCRTASSASYRVVATSAKPTPLSTCRPPNSVSRSSRWPVSAAARATPRARFRIRASMSVQSAGHATCRSPSALMNWLTTTR
jgi:hypothetical protein